MNLQAAVAALADIPAKITAALQGATALAEANASLKSENAALTAKVAAFEASHKSAIEEAAQAKADASAALAAKAEADKEIEALKTNARTVDSAAEAKAKAILAAQGTTPVSDRGTGSLSGSSANQVHVGPDGKPLRGIALAIKLNEARNASAPSN